MKVYKKNYIKDEKQRLNFYLTKIASQDHKLTVYTTCGMCKIDIDGDPPIQDSD
jgi:hypothetical protein